MNKQILLLVFFYLLYQALAIIPEWNLNSSGEDLFGSENEITYTINHRNLFNVEMKLEKKIIRDNSGKITMKNNLKINNLEAKEVEFEQVESFYFSNHHYIVCPKGSFHPYNFIDGKEIIPKNFSEKKWDLRCYRENYNDKPFLLVIYLMNGDNNNIFMTNTDSTINWFDGLSISKKEIYDYLIKNETISGKVRTYQMMSILNNENNIELRYSILTLIAGYGKQNHELKNNRVIIKTGKYAQAYFKNITVFDNNKYFYYFTYNNISDFSTGYSGPIPRNYDYSLLDNISLTKNDYPHLEFLNDVEIEEMNFLLYNKFLYYKMRDKTNGNIYHGIFDIVLNKIIFNTNEKIITFIPHSSHAMLAITENTAYKICTYKNKNECVDTCSNEQYLLDIDGNKCGSSCPNNKILFNPSGVCINDCDENIYVLSNNVCQLCKDKDSSMPFKFYKGRNCLSDIPTGAVYYNEKLKLLQCGEGYHYENDKCVPNKNCYKLCKDCSENSTDESNQKCTGCISGFILDANTGNCHCDNGYEINDKNCNQCSNSCKAFKINSCDCISCNDTSFLENNRCLQCPSNCKEMEDNSCKCKSCKEGQFLESYYCKNCSSNCKTCNKAEVCDECFDGYYKGDNSCKRCSELCQTCDGRIENEDHHCLSCDKDKEKKYLINENNRHICVNSCIDYNLTLDTSNNVCISNNKNETKDNGNGKRGNDNDYIMLWIFAAVIGVLLIIISICICRKIFCQKNEIESIDEMGGELIEQ